MEGDSLKGDAILHQRQIEANVLFDERHWNGIECSADDNYSWRENEVRLRRVEGSVRPIHDRHFGQLRFWVRANSLAQPNSEFRKHGRAIFDFNWYRAVEFMSLFYLPSVATFFKFKVIIKYFAVLIHETYPIKYSLRYFRSSLQISYVNLLATLWMNVRIMVWFETIWSICWFRFERKTKIKPSRLLNRVWVSILQDVHCNQKLTNI